MSKTLIGFCLFLAGCANTDFPFCCDQTGDKNVPYTTTYHFNTATGFSDIGGDKSLLSIVSQGDLANLFNAANVSKVPGTGAVGGAVSSLSGDPVENVILEATDVYGNKIGDLFYNSLGGIPDFSTTAGTSTNGGFTLLNVPPGEVYIRAVQGGRGNTSLSAFAEAVSVGGLSVVPVTPPVIGVTGGVKDYETETNIANAIVTPLGLSGRAVVSTSANYRFPSLGSDSFFIIKAAASGFSETYQELHTDLSSRPQGATDVTKNLYLLSDASVTAISAQVENGFRVDKTQGMLLGATRDTDDSYRLNPYVLLTDDQGTLLNFDQALRSRIYYRGSYFDTGSGTNIPTFFTFDATGTVVKWYISPNNFGTHDCKTDYVKNQRVQTCPPPSVGILDGKFVAFNLPPGVIHITATALEKVENGFGYYAGEALTDIFPGSATVKDVTMNQMPLGKNSFYQAMTGNVTESNGISPVSFAVTSALGNSSSMTTSDLYGNFNVLAGSNIFLDQSTYLFKISHPLYLDTYQEVKIDNLNKNLIIYSSALVNQFLGAAGLASQMDVTRGILTGTIMDNASGRGTDGVQLEATDPSGNAVGDVRYFDSSGMPILTGASSKNGGYIIFNLPPGLVQIRVVSPDDSGNILAHLYPNGVVVADLHVNNSPPPTLQVSGVTTDLKGTPLGNVNLSVIGEKKPFTSDAGGSFTQKFETYGSFMVKARAPAGGMDTYNLFSTVTADIRNLNLFAMTSPQAQVLAVGLSLDPVMGLLGGKVTTEGFSPAQPVSGFLSSPMTDIGQQKMVAGLFDEDNEVDLAVTNSKDNTLTILLGGGDGTFRKATGSPICLPRGLTLLPGQTCSTLAAPIAVRSVDLNNDGIQDLVVVNSGADSITILLGTKKGNFIPVNSPCHQLPAGPACQLPAGSHPVAVSIGDFNSDGITDLVVLNSGNNTFTWIPGNGDGTFSSTMYSYFSGGASPSAILSRDFNGDGNPDLAIANSISGTVSVYLGVGNGLFIPAPQSPISVGSLPVAIAAEDLNGDGVVDLVVANSGSGTITVLLGNGKGLFSPAKYSPISLSSPPQFVAVNDINFDGRPDILTASSSGNISVLTGLGDGTFTAESLYSVGGNPTNLVIADFNDDTYSDAVAYQASAGTLAFLPGIEVPVSGISLMASDLSGNRAGDVRYLDAGGNVIPAAVQTDGSGRFLIFNVPSGITNVHATQNASGNRFMTAYPGSATLGTVNVVPPDTRKINFSGRTMDAVGVQISRFVESVGISFLGTGVRAVSDPVNSTFNVNTDANSFMIIKLQK